MEEVFFVKSMFAFTRGRLKIILEPAQSFIDDSSALFDPKPDLVALTFADQERAPVINGC